MFKIAIFQPAVCAQKSRNHNFKKPLYSPRHTNKKSLVQMWGFQALLASDLTSDMILRYCAICPQSPVVSVFDENWIKSQF